MAKLSMHNGLRNITRQYDRIRRPIRQHIPAQPQKTVHKLESDGKASCEFDILETDKAEIKVEVDATPGKIVEVSDEEYQIGKD